MSPKTMQILSSLCLLAAMVLMVLSLERFGNWPTIWISLPLIIASFVLTIRAAGRRGTAGARRKEINE